MDGIHVARSKIETNRCTGTRAEEDLLKDLRWEIGKTGDWLADAKERRT